MIPKIIRYCWFGGKPLPEEAKKKAFVSDYARFWILYNYGELYFDTDVEIIKGIDDLVIKGPFMGSEPYINGSYRIAAGLGLCVEPTWQ